MAKSTTISGSNIFQLSKCILLYWASAKPGGGQCCADYILSQGLTSNLPVSCPPTCHPGHLTSLAKATRQKDKRQKYKRQALVQLASILPCYYPGHLTCLFFTGVSVCNTSKIQVSYLHIILSNDPKFCNITAGSVAQDAWISVVIFSPQRR